MVDSIWSSEIEPVTDPVRALQELAGQLRHAVNVLGAHVDADALALEGATALAWTKVLRELRMALVEMERLGLSRREVELAEGQAQIVVFAFRKALAALPQLLPADRSLATQTFLGALGRGDEGGDMGRVTAAVDDQVWRILSRLDLTARQWELVGELVPEEFRRGGGGAEIVEGELV